MPRTPSKDMLAKKGEDGLTKYQRYYQKNSAQIRMKNKQCEKEKREAKRREKEIEKPSTQTATVDTSLSSEPATNLTDKSTANHTKLTDKSTAYRTKANMSNSSAMLDFFAWMDPDFLVGARMDNDPNAMNRPPDFFENMPWLREHKYEAAVDKVVGPRGMEEIARPQMFDELEQLYRIKKNVINWSSGWSGSANWNRQLDRSFIMAVDNGRVEHWRKQVYSHTTWGRGLLAQLEILDHRLPNEHWKVRELWRLRLELAEAPTRGVTILEMKNSILPGLSTVRYKDMASAQETDDGSAMNTDDSESGSDSDDDPTNLNLWEMWEDGNLWEEDSGDASDDGSWVA